MCHKHTRNSLSGKIEPADMDRFELFNATLWTHKVILYIWNMVAFVVFLRFVLLTPIFFLNQIFFGSRCRSESAGTIYERQTTKPKVQTEKIQLHSANKFSSGCDILLRSIFLEHTEQRISYWAFWPRITKAFKEITYKNKMHLLMPKVVHDKIRCR